MSHHIKCLSKTIIQNNYTKCLQIKRFLSTQEAVERRSQLFTLEKKRQLGKVGRIEKIEVKYKGLPNECTLIMNKDISTPYDCARHLSEWHMNTSALALIDGTVYWDMHRPLSQNCVIELYNFTVAEPQHVNRAFWRTCSFLLGACVSIAFKETVPVILHSFPGPNIRSGSFIYDVDLPSLPDWKPNQQELHTLGAEFVKLTRANQIIERLDVGEELALEMFIENEHKTKQIPNIAKSNGNITLYRVGNHVDISRGPLISSSGQIGKVSVTSVHKLIGSPDSEIKQLYRFQGVALPIGTMLNHFAFSIITERAKKLNPTKSPINSFMEKIDSEQQGVAATA